MNFLRTIIQALFDDGRFATQEDVTARNFASQATVDAAKTRTDAAADEAMWLAFTQ